MNSKPLPLCQAIDRDQVAAVVARFYKKVLADETLAPYFRNIDDWPRHEGYIVDFWWGVMGGEVSEPRPGAMLSGHQGLNISPQAMRHWLQLFAEASNEQLPPDEAEQWQAIARGIATMMGEHGLVEKGE